MTSIIDAQCQSERLKTAVKHFVSSKVKPKIGGILEFLLEVSAGFSVAHISHDIMQFLKAFSKHPEGDIENLIAIVNLLVTKFEVSFRPTARDVFELCKLYAIENLECFSAILILLRKSLLNQQPKQQFQLISIDFIPFLNTLPSNLLERNLVLIESIIGLLFPGTVPLSKKTDAKLLESLSLVKSLEISRMVLRRFVSVYSSDSFPFFLDLLPSDDLSIQMGLWQTLSELHVYQVRGSDDHCAALERFYNQVINADMKWTGIHVVLQVDPVSFTDRVLLLIENDDDSTDKRIVQSYLFKMFASKGSLADIVLKGSQIDMELEISPIDYVSTMEILMNENRHTLLISLLENKSLETIGSNLRPNIVLLIETKLKELKKPQKHSLLVLALIDAHYVVHVAWTVWPQECDDLILNCLRQIANQDSENRAAALIRLVLFNSEPVTHDELVDCVNGNEVLADSMLNPRNKSCLMHHVEGLVPIIEERAEEPKTKKMKIGEIETLLKKTEAIIEKFGRDIFVPPILRKNDFPLDVLAIESVWESFTGDLNGLPQTQSLVYGLSVRMEHKTAYTETISVETVPLLLQARFLLAQHGMKPSKDSGEALVVLAGELMGGERDLPAIETTYFCLFTGITTERDKRKVRLPWWTCKVHLLIPGMRGLLGACINGIECRTESATYLVRIWKTLADSFSREKKFRFNKSIPIICGEYIRLSHQVGECSKILDKGCALLIEKLEHDEVNFFHAMLGKTDREVLKRINLLLETNFKYTGRA